jgi:GntR family transcriptional regulator
MDHLTRHVPVPLYYQIMRRLVDLLESGQLAPGDRVPSERELTERFGVSRMTARQALAELERQGLVLRVQGKGSFVAHAKLEQPLGGLTSFSEEMLRRGLTPGARLLSAGVVPAGRKAAQALAIPEAAGVIRMERLRLAGGEPMALEVSSLPYARVPGIERLLTEEGSLYRLLREQYNLVLARARQSLEAIPCPAHEAGLIQVREGSPVLLIERIAYDASGIPTEFTRSWYRGDRYRFTTELIRTEEDLL